MVDHELLFGLMLLGFLVLGVLLVSLVVLVSGLRGRVRDLELEVHDVGRRLALLRREPPPAVAPAPEPVPAAAPRPAPAAPAAAVAVAPQPPPLPALPPPAAAERPVAVAAPAPAMRPPPAETPEAMPEAPGIFESKAGQLLRAGWNWFCVGDEHRPKNLSPEFAIASTWLLRLSAVIFLFGVGYFLHYSIRKGWLPPTLRVGLSLLAGAGLVAGGARLLSRRWQALGQGLVGAGLGTLYFSLFAASRFYGLLPLPASFGLMAAVTAAAGVMAVRLDSLLIAVLGLVGGYLTPVLLSTGTGNLPALYSYLLLLGAGVLATAAFRRWHLLQALALAGTWGLYLAALGKYYDRDLHFPTALGFLIAFFALFTATTLVHNLLRREKCTVLEMILLHANAAVTGVAGVWLLRDACGPRWPAALTLGLSATYLGLVAILLRRKLQDPGLLVSLLMLASVFLGVSVPLLLDGRWVTAAWAVQALAMLWAAGRLRSGFLRTLAYVLYAVMLGRLAFLDFPALGRIPTTNVAAAKYLTMLLQRLAAYGIPLLALAGAWKLGRRAEAAAGAESAKAAPAPASRPVTVAGSVLLAASLGLLFLFLQVELFKACLAFHPPLRHPALTVVWCAAVLLLWARAGQRPLAAWRVALGFGIAALLLFKLAAFDFAAWAPLRLSGFRYGDGFTVAGLLLRTADFLLAFGVLGWAFLCLPRRGTAGERLAGRLAGAAAMALLFVWSTWETGTALDRFLPGLRAGGVTLLWALFALGLLLGGIRHASRRLRYAGLALFAVVAWKLFFHDLAALETVYKVAALFGVALLLFAGAFLYQKHRGAFEVAAGGDGQPPE
ncbi:MAG: DUF2339 domain-containing protein [Lentisphaeria bacterium]|jgi:uncharacterized membrane protein